jgi:hypothetical protein
VAHPQIAVFARLASGNDQRLRAIEGQATMLGRTMHGIAYDPIHDEIVVPQQFGQGILTFAGDAAGETPPKRVIMGPKTRLIALDRLGVDPRNNEIYVPEGKRLLVFERTAHGDVAPKRVLEGPETGIYAARAVAIDHVRDLLLVASQPPARESGERPRGQIRIFERTASGNAKAIRVIEGASSGQNIAVYPEGGWLLSVGRGQVAVWSVEDSGEAPPRFIIGKGTLREPRGVTVDPKNRAVIISDKELNAALTFFVPEMFANAPATGSGRQQ